MPKARLVGEKETAGAVPVPESAEVCGLPAALSATLKVAEREPVAVGVNVTVIVQEIPFVSDEPHELAREKSPGFEPVSVGVMPVTVEPVLFVSVKVCAPLEAPTRKEPKLFEAGDSVMVPPAPLVVKAPAFHAPLLGQLAVAGLGQVAPGKSPVPYVLPRLAPRPIAADPACKLKLFGIFTKFGLVPQTSVATHEGDGEPNQRLCPRVVNVTPPVSALPCVVE